MHWQTLVIGSINSKATLLGNTVAAAAAAAANNGESLPPAQ